VRPARSHFDARCERSVESVRPLADQPGQISARAGPDGTSRHLIRRSLCNGLFAGGLYALLEHGYSLGYDAARRITIAHGAVMMVGSYVAGRVFQVTAVRMAIEGAADICGLVASALMIERVIVLSASRSGDVLAAVIRTFVAGLSIQAVASLGAAPLDTLGILQARGTPLLTSACCVVVAVVPVTASMDHPLRTAKVNADTNPKSRRLKEVVHASSRTKDPTIPRTTE
jgi:branched-subunit amino acid ABC-type transport system permease component